MGKDREQGIGLKEKVPGLAMITAGATGLWIGWKVNQLWRKAVNEHPSGSRLREVERELSSLSKTNFVGYLNEWSRNFDEKDRLETAIKEDIDPYNFRLIGSRVLPLVSAIAGAAGVYRLLKPGRKKG